MKSTIVQLQLVVRSLSLCIVGEVRAEHEAIEEVRMLSLEFPDHEYLYEGVLEG